LNFKIKMKLRMTKQMCRMRMILMSRIPIK
jgi:hypothetical protein